MTSYKNIALALWLASIASTSPVDAFTATTTTATTTVTSSHPSTSTNTFAYRRNTALGVSVARDFLESTHKGNNNNNNNEGTHSATDAALMKAFETQSPESFGLDGPGIATTRQSNKNHRRHNFKELAAFLKEDPDLDFYTLHSSAVSHLHKDMPINDITRAIKRAQNLHDRHDLATIAAFLIEECDESWGYGFRGSLLSRLAVAALHSDEVDIGMGAIETRRIFERPSMKPYESAAIVRGLMRVGLLQEGWDVLQDELRLPLVGTPLDSAENQDIIKHRTLALCSIATRHLFHGEPDIAAKALKEMSAMGPLVAESHVTLDGGLTMPWARLVTAAEECNAKVAEADAKGDTSSLLRQQHEAEEDDCLPSDLVELVWETMSHFPCPNEEEECTLDDYFNEP